jgi:hypothetical protein
VKLERLNIVSRYHRDGTPMCFLSRIRLATKLSLLLSLSALAVVASIGAAASILHQRTGAAMAA